MKDIRAATRTILLADSPVSVAVGAARIYPGILPQGITLPSIVQNLISEQIDYHMGGDDGLVSARVQIDSWALTQDAAVLLANLVFDALSGYSGTVVYGSNSPQDTMVIRAVFHDQGRDDYDSTAKMFVRHRDYLFWYGED